MKKKQKLNVLLGMTDHLASTYSSMVKEYSKFFKNNQGAFLGEKRTYTPKEGQIDEPGKRKNSLVQTTVNEKFDWLKDNAKEYVDALFAVEATNASGVAKTELVVEGETWGEFTSLELLRLKSLIENNDIKNMLENIPVRSDAVRWEANTLDEYLDRDIHQTPLSEGVEKTTMKETYVLEDPNINKLKDGVNYTPQLATKNTVVELGDYTHQTFSGEWTQKRKADALKRRGILLTAVVTALKECNEVEIKESTLNSDKIFGYLLG